ncbi:MAG: class II fructose-bisphosphate aldolase [Candidatus Levyibacteriota bacterium]|nr:MAG: class II fructose-bisphosphate aldolase [Candidatus Levybacteria bacterium]
MNIDQLIHTALFSDFEEEKKTARNRIRSLAKEKGIISSSIYPFYMALGQDEAPTSFTVPAINIRTLTYQTATIIFFLMQKHHIGPVVFEIARSEIDYTDQRPDEYAIAILAGAIKANYKGPVFIQGDHYQLSKKKYTENPAAEVQKIKDLIKESIEADFLNIDIDASTLVDLEKPTQSEQQQDNYNVTAELTEYIRNLEPKNTTISIGAEIGHIGGKNSTPDELKAFMEGYLPKIQSLKGISKISVQTGTSHGGILLPDGGMADVKLDFNVIKETGAAARNTYHLGGVVQHGASTLPNELFGEFPKNKTLEIHLATGFQNIVYDNIPVALREKMYEWIKNNCKKEWEEDWNEEQFIYKTRKKALGPFKKQLFELGGKDKQKILAGLEKQLSFLFQKLNVIDTKKFIEKLY